MKLKLFSVTLLISLFLCSNAALCEDIGVKTDSTSSTNFSKDKFSIGLNSLPWSASGVSLRWWDKNKSGSELIVNVLGLAYDPRDFSYNIGPTEIDYTWFDRNEILGVNNMFLVKGMGFGLDYYIYGDSSSRRGHVYLKILFPFGIEHFFYSGIPNLSYTVDATFYGAIGVDSQDGCYVKLGVTPKFYFRWYF